VTLTDQSGCSITDSVTIGVAFDNLITPINLSACEGQSLVLDAGFPGSTYSWNTNATSQTITVDQSGQYTATITDIQACQAIKTFNVTINPLPVVDLGPDLALCGVTQQTLDAGNAGNAVVWNTGSTAHQITVNSSGTYSVMVTSPQGCQASDAVSVALNPLPTDVLQDIMVCETTPVVLDAGNAGSTYAWSSGETTQTIEPATSGTYSVTVTTAQQCSATFDAAVTLMPSVHVDLGPDLERCTGDPVTLDPGPVAGTLLWNTGATTPQLAVTASGTYSVTATNGYCSDTDSVAVLFHPLPVDQLTDQTACAGQSIVLDAGNPGAVFAWNNGATAASITVTAPGTYTVSITSADGCQASYTADAQFVDPPVVNLGADTVLCAGQLLALSAGGPGSTCQWSTGSTANSVMVGTTGQYSVSVSNGYCATEDSILVLFNPAPEPMPKHQLFTCLDEDPHYVEVDAGNPGSTYLWGDGQTTRTVRANAYGWWNVTITNVFGCSLTDSALVNSFCRPTFFLPNAFTPNGDGVNDVWLPVGNNIGFYEMYVFDRWGGVVFHSTDPNTGWDGKLNGQDAPNDAYAYRVTFRLVEDPNGSMGFEQTKLGHVQVVR
jgi:gliding motility-associated-like protein